MGNGSALVMGADVLILNEGEEVWVARTLGRWGGWRVSCAGW